MKQRVRGLSGCSGGAPQRGARLAGTEREEMVLVAVVAGLGEPVSSFPKVTKRSCQYLPFANRSTGCAMEGSAPAFPGAAWFPRTWREGGTAI